MASKIVINELNKKKEELLQFINKLENIIEQKKEDIYHIENTISIFESSQNPSEINTQTQENSKEDSQPSHVIKHDFKKQFEKRNDNAINENLQNAINTQKQKVKKLHQDEKEVLKQFKQLMRG